MENIDTYSNTVNEKKESNSDVQKLLSQPYKYGFTTDVEVEEFPKGINTDIIKLISEKKGEPKFMLDFRLRAYNYWQKMVAPTWASVHYTDINYQDILYYSAPKKKKEFI
jgi:Fe-S cluster assembly protein SufB